MFWKKKILNRMMEFQVKFCHHSGLRLWRTGMLFSTKSKGHKSNFRISEMYRYSCYDLKVHFWWPNECWKHQVLRWNTGNTYRVRQCPNIYWTRQYLISTQLDKTGVREQFWTARCDTTWISTQLDKFILSSWVDIYLCFQWNAALVDPWSHRSPVSTLFLPAK